MKRRATAIPGWLALANAWHPLFNPSDKRLKRIKWVRHSEMKGNYAQALLRAGWIDARESTHGRYAYFGVHDVLHGLLGERGIDVELLDAGMERLWSKCRELLALELPPTGRGRWPPWLPALRVEKGLIARRGGKTPCVSYFALSFRVQPGLTRADLVVANMITSFFRDLPLLFGPGVEQCPLRNCMACAQVFIATCSPRSDASDARGSTHLYCSSACRQAYLREMKRDLAVARAQPRELHKDRSGARTIARLFRSKGLGRASSTTSGR